MNAPSIPALLYEELRCLAAHHLRSERPGHTLQPTALVHEVYLRLSKQDNFAHMNRLQFLALGSRMVRRVLVDHARQRDCVKRGRGWTRVAHSEPDSFNVADLQEGQLIALDEALKELKTLNRRHFQVVELRFFGGLTVEETAELLVVSTRTVVGDWRQARAWLMNALQGSV
jgi:RNA polymerase sigma-70 factor, ECF subfamily